MSTSTVVKVVKKTGLVNGEGQRRDSLRLSAYMPAVTAIP
jgi:hypothetical protein